MSWFKVDDRLWGHPKWLSCPLRSRSLWVTAGSWSSAMGTDGHVPSYVLPMFGAKPSDAVALVNAGLWELASAGWQFHDWDIFQPDAISVAAKRGKQSMGGKEGNHNRWHAGRHVVVPDCPWCIGTDSVTDRVTESLPGESVPNPPDPTRPDPITDSDPDGSHFVAKSVSDRRLGDSASRDALKLAI